MNTETNCAVMPTEITTVIVRKVDNGYIIGESYNSQKIALTKEEAFEIAKKEIA